MSQNIADSLRQLSNYTGDDFKKIGSAPLSIRIVMTLLFCAIIAAASVWLLIIPTQEKLTAVTAKEQDLRQAFSSEQAKVANLAAYKNQMVTIEKSFSMMLRQLPNEIDIESLLVDLSQTSIAAGLSVDFFKPEPEVRREFYSEYPIELKVTGTYHELGAFVSGLAALPRIVTLSDISINPLSENSEEDNFDNELIMELKATTYRYMEEDI